MSFLLNLLLPRWENYMIATCWALSYSVPSGHCISQHRP